jgi:hypothetical protein
LAPPSIVNAAPVRAAAPSPDVGPRLAVLFAGQLVFAVLTTCTNVAWLMPVLARLRFAAGDWQTTLVTAAVPTFLVVSIFWNELLQRVSLRRYLLIYWLVAILPLGVIALAQSYAHLLTLHIIGCIGAAGWTPAYGKLLQRFYPDHVRGRVFAVLNAAQLVATMGVAFTFGGWLERNDDAFRVFLPVAAAGQALGMLLLLRLARYAGADDRPARAAPLDWAALVRPVLHMGAVLRKDRVFRRYEQAFMTYGAAFMLCEALLPVLATTRLGMGYHDYSMATRMAMAGATLLLTLPMGAVHDRLGPIRTSGLAFALLVLYPLGLVVATGLGGVVAASVVFGAGMAGVQMGWMLGPVTLAGRADKVPQYVAIHTTLVGLRGVVFQGVGMAIYQLSGSFTVPLLLAATAFGWAAVQMWRLQGVVGRRARAAT